MSSKKILLILTLFCLHYSNFSEASEEDLCKKMEKSALLKLQRLDLKFKPLEKSQFVDEVQRMFELEDLNPACLRGDFDGDNKKDYAIMGSAGENYIIAFLFHKKNEYFVSEVVRSQFLKSQIGEDSKYKVYISLLDSGKIKFKEAGISKRDAVQVENYLGLTVSYYFNGKKILEYDGEPL